MTIISKKTQIKIAIISHALVQEESRNRWKILAKDPKYEVNLIVPKYWESTWFGKDEINKFETKEFHEKNFHIYPLPTTNNHNWTTYLFKSYDLKFNN